MMAPIWLPFMWALASTAQALSNLSEQPLSTDLTISLVEHNNTSASCDTTNAPTIHITGFRNTSSVCVSIDVFTSNYTLDDPRGSLINYTISNAGNYKNTTLYPTLWYQQLSQKVSQNQEKLTVGTLELRTYPCSNCAMTCPDEATRSTSSPALAGPVLESGEWLQWNCFAEGACYPTTYDIKGFFIQTAVDTYNSLNSAEQNNKCELSAVTNGDASNNNNTDLGSGGGQGAGLVLGILGSTVLLAAGVVTSILMFG